MGALGGVLRSEEGQGTVEFCLVASVLVIVAGGLWAMAQAFSGGLLADHAVASASHALSATPISVLADIFAV